MVDLIDAILTVLFTPLKLFGVKKCGKCAVRVRYAQFMLIVSAPVRRIGAIKSRRVDWSMKAEGVRKIDQITLLSFSTHPPTGEISPVFIVEKEA